jgi:hypothetical protein
MRVLPKNHIDQESVMDASEGVSDILPPEATLPPRSTERVVPNDRFCDAFGEPIERTLDLTTWLPGEDLASLYQKLEAEVKTAIAHESSVLRTIRQTVLPIIGNRDNAPKEAGVFRATPAQIERTHHAILFNGGVEAVDGTVAFHDTLAMTISQIGVCQVAYHGNSGSWVHQLYRRDLRSTIADPIEEATRLIERRQQQPAINQSERGNQVSQLAQRGIMAYAERAVLIERSTAPWRMGHGNPVPYELLTGSGSMPLLSASLEKLHQLVGVHRKFVFVPSAPRDRGLLTIGHALMPLEYAVIDTMTDRMLQVVENGHYDKTHLAKAGDFVHEIGPQVVLGLYRTTQAAPPQVFYAHRDHVHVAALIAMADSSLQELRAFPMLIDLADTLCRTTFGPSHFADSVRLAYTEAKHPYRYLGERESRQ